MSPLKYGKYYHVYNRGNNRGNNWCDLFLNEDDYEHFLRLYEKYINPVAETFAWVLMRNHFHLLVRIKEAGEIRYKLSNADRSVDAVRLKILIMSISS
jgi:putative transposase